MEQLNRTPITGKFGDVAKVLDTNFGLIVTKLMELSEASKAKKMNCGFYSSETELKTAYPNPDKGMMAYVGSGIDYTVYRCKTDGEWTATSETFKVNISVDLSTFATKDALAQVKGSVDSLLLGAVYCGIAARTTNPGTQKTKVFYLPTEVGEYPNFGNLSVVENEIAFLYYDGTNWTKQSVDFSNDFNDINNKLSDLYKYFNDETQNYIFGYMDAKGDYNHPNDDYITCLPVEVEAGITIVWNKGTTSSTLFLVEYDKDGKFIQSTNSVEHTLSNITKYIAASFSKTGKRNITRKDGTIIFEPKIVSNTVSVADKVKELDSIINIKEKFIFDVFNGYYINDKGKEVSNNYWATTDYIPLTGVEFKKLYIKKFTIVNSASFYDEHHNYLYGFLNRNLSLANFIWNAECKYVRFCFDIRQYVEDESILIYSNSNLADRIDSLENQKNSGTRLQHPSVIYNVGNDIDTNTFERNFCASIYMDNIIGEFLKKEPLLRFDNGCIKKNIACYEPVMDSYQAYGSWEKPFINGGKATFEETIKVGIKNSNFTDGFNIVNRCTLNTKSKGNARILILGDSVTAGQNAYFPNSMISADYTSLLKQMFDKDNLQSSSTDYNLMTLGTVIHTREFSYKGEKLTIKAFNEGYGGKTLSWLFNSSNMVVNGVFSFNNWLNKYRTCDKQGNRLYFDTQKRPTGSAGTSNKGYLEDGTDSGLFIGSMVSNTLAYDVCEPTHVFLAYGNNAAITKNEYNSFISYVKASFPNAIIGLGITKVSGTFFPSQYPNMANVSLWDTYMQAESYWRKQKACQDVLDEIANDTTYEKKNVFVIPLYYVNPSADAISAMKINEPYRDSEDGEDTYLAKGQHPDVHVGGKAHAAYAYQLYSWIKWTIASGLVL